MTDSRAFYTLDDFDFSDRTVLLRVDINSPIDPTTHEILDDTRMEAVKPTIKDLEGAKVVILGHQSSPGKKDFTSLKRHAERLSSIMGKKVRYIDSLFDAKAISAIRRMRKGELVLLENTRFYSEDVALKGKAPEVQAKSHLVKKLSAVADFYVCDAFAAAHRSQPTLVGFPEVLPGIAGRLMEKELVTLEKFLTGQGAMTAILGGAKVDDSIEVMQYMLSNGTLSEVLTGGVVSNIFLKAKGYDLGQPNDKFLEKEVPEYPKLVKTAKELIKQYPEQIQVPDDVALNENGQRTGIPVSLLPSKYPIYDIGLEATVDYVHRIANADRVILNGPMGVFEMEEFAFGTEEVLKAIADSKAFSVVGGGHTIAAVAKFDLEGKIGHVSTGGGALINMLTGKELPVVEALKKSKLRFDAKMKK
jgi:phosphoglycerate kinase